MQIMNLGKLFKDICWSLSASKAIEELPDSVILIDSEGFVTRVNKKATECFGITVNEFDPVKIEDFISEGIEAVKTSAKLRKPIAVTAQIPGRNFLVELNASKKDGNYCLIIRDITKLTEEIATEEKIARFNGEKNAMLVKLESDIKSPLTSIAGFSQGLLDGLGGELSEKQAKYIKIIRSNSNDLYYFMDKFLEFTYAESSLYKSDYQTFDIVETFQAIAKDFHNQMEDKKLAFDINYESIEKRTVFTDHSAIQKIFRNLLDTSIAMTDNGYILVKLSHPDEETASRMGLDAKEIYTSHLQITIKDTGLGITDEEMKCLCDPYAQLEKGKKNFLRAVRLGTASILTKRAEGYINITSSVMKGTRYDIIIPIEKDKYEQRNT